jgi:serine/threonine-protein kinase MRCK
VIDLQERVDVQAKDLLEAQQQRKLAVQEFTDVNEKVNEWRSKHIKLSNEFMRKEDELLDIKQDLDKKERMLDEWRTQAHTANERIKVLENEKVELQSRLSSIEAAAVANKMAGEAEATAANELSKKQEELLSEQLSKEVKQLELKLTNSLAQISQLEDSNTSLLNEAQATKEKNTLQMRDLNAKFQEQLSDLSSSKEKEINFLHSEIKKLTEEIEKVIIVVPFLFFFLYILIQQVKFLCL